LADGGRDMKGLNMMPPLVPTNPVPGNGYAVLPLRDIVVFPHMIVPLFVGREKSIKALEEVMGADKQILLATQKNASDDDPEPTRSMRSARSPTCCSC
jgi:ATP-dependent Lon protease